MKLKLFYLLVMLTIAIAIITPAKAESIYQYSTLIGWTVIGVSSYPGWFTGLKIGDVIQLENGWAFKSFSFAFTSAFRPAVIVFANSTDTGIPIYRLLIKDNVYDVTSAK